MGTQLGLFGVANAICSVLMWLFRHELVASVDACSVHEESLNGSFAKKSLRGIAMDSNMHVNSDVLVENEA